MTPLRWPASTLIAVVDSARILDEFDGGRAISSNALVFAWRVSIHKAARARGPSPAPSPGADTERISRILRGQVRRALTLFAEEPSSSAPRV